MSAASATSTSSSSSDFFNKDKLCSICSSLCPRSQFSKTQWSKMNAAKCNECITASNGNSSNMQQASEPSLLDNSNKNIKLKKSSNPTSSPTKIIIIDREQCEIPGFDGLTCCKDWPQTKKGEPPVANSAVFNPLIGCLFGPISSYSKQEDIDFAIEWWTKALPAWPRWIQELKDAGVNDEKLKFYLSRAKGNPNQLIPKTKGHGTVPHFRGKDQVDILEMAPMVSIELYACVTCMYSQAALECNNQ